MSDAEVTYDPTDDAPCARCGQPWNELARLREELAAQELIVMDYKAQVDTLLAALMRVESVLRPIASDNPVYERTTAHFDAHGIARVAISEVEEEK